MIYLIIEPYTYNKIYYWECSCYSCSRNRSEKTKYEVQSLYKQVGSFWYFLNLAAPSPNLERNMINKEHICVLKEHGCADTCKARN